MTVLLFTFSFKEATCDVLYECFMHVAAAMSITEHSELAYLIGIGMAHGSCAGEKAGCKVPKMPCQREMKGLCECRVLYNSVQPQYPIMQIQEFLN